MPNTLAENLQRLVDARTGIASSITTKEGTVNIGDGFEEFPSDILGIPSGAQVFSITGGQVTSGYGFFDGSVLVLAALIVSSTNGIRLNFPQALSNYGFNPSKAITGSYLCGSVFRDWKQYDLSGDSTGMNITKNGSDNYNAFCGIWTLPA